MPVLEIDLDVYCSCGNGLCRQSNIKNNTVTVEPCEKCLSDKYDRGYEEGEDEGYKQAEKDFKEEK